MTRFSVSWSMCFVGMRAVMIWPFFFNGPIAAAFALSEAAALYFTVGGLRKGKVDASFTALLTPICYMAPLLLDTSPAPAGGIFFGVLVLAAAVTQVGLRLWMGRRVSVGVPVFRSMLTTGPYRVIRHPLATCEVILVLGLACFWPSLWNAAAAAVAVAGIVLALLLEERFLRSIEDYRIYAAAVRWRMFPGF